MFHGGKARRKPSLWLTEIYEPESRSESVWNLQPTIAIKINAAKLSRNPRYHGLPRWTIQFTNAHGIFTHSPDIMLYILFKTLIDACFLHPHLCSFTYLLTCFVSVPGESVYSIRSAEPARFFFPTANDARRQSIRWKLFTFLLRTASAFNIRMR